MGKLREKIKDYAAIAMISAAIAYFVGGFIIQGSRKTYETNREIYRGYTELSDDGRIVYVFDSQNKMERGSRAPKHKVCGNRSLIDCLKMGKPYLFTTEKRSFPWSKKYIKVILPYKLGDSKNELR